MTGGWDEVNAALAAARAEVAAAAPDAATAAEGEAYVARVVTASLNDAFLGHLMTDGGLSRALPVRGGPNPDYILASAPVERAGRYRLKGRLNQSERVGVGLYAFGAGRAPVISAYTAFDRHTTDAEGGFDLEIAADPAPGGLAIAPDARLLLIRTLHREPEGQPARLVLEGASRPRDLALAQGSAEGALAQAARVTLTGVRQFLEWSAATSAAPNRFLTELPELSQGVQGDANTDYHLGYFQLGAGEWLEVTMPPGVPGYWSLHAYNHWCEALLGAGAHDRNATPDADGCIRIAIGPDAPHDASNRVDTRGRRRGVLICRLIDAPGVGAPQAVLRHPQH